MSNNVALGSWVACLSKTRIQTVLYSPPWLFERAVLTSHGEADITRPGHVGLTWLVVQLHVLQLLTLKSAHCMPAVTSATQHSIYNIVLHNLASPRTTYSKEDST